MNTLDASWSTRTRNLGIKVREALLQKGVSEKSADDWAHSIAAEFGSMSEKRPLETNEIVILGPEEWKAVDQLTSRLAKEKRKPTEEELKGLERPTTALDVAMFGRMRAAAKEVNVDAAVQVAHAITVNQVRVETDYWTAVEELNLPGQSGAGGINEREFGSGVFYVYTCIDVPALVKNLGGNGALAGKGAEALVRSIATIGPGGHRNSFANRVYAQYVRVEVGTAQPRTLAGAFERAVDGTRKGLTIESIEALEGHALDMDRAYGKLYEQASVLDVPGKRGTLDDILGVVRRAMT
jgi:CRISPR system Cascade subunit CasC